jgi:hypothetical protein
MKNTTIQIPIELNARIRRLAILKSQEMGLSTTLGQRAYIEMLILQEEQKEEKKAHGNAKVG